MVIFLLALLFLVCYPAQQFQCNFEMQQGSPGRWRGVLKYDWTAKRMLVTYTTSNLNELLRYNSSGGYPASPSDGVTSTASTWATDCSCSSAVVTTPMPLLFRNPPNSIAQGGITSITFGPDGFPTTAVFANGRSFTYSGCRTQAYPESTYALPSGCACNQPLDVVIVLDRSCSIDRSEFVQQKDFTTKLVNSFNVAPENTNIGISNFHTWTWDGPVNLPQGTTSNSVNTGASALQCWDGNSRNTNQQCLANGSPSCCGCGTCISCGLVTGADMLKTSTRPNAPKILVLLTDGYHNLVLNRNGDTFLPDSRGSTKANGKPYRNPRTGGTCSESNSQISDPCYVGLNADIQWAVDYAKRTVPGVQIYSVGVGSVYQEHQLIAVADGKPQNVLATRDWAKLPALAAQISQLVCPQVSTCTNCCGLCACPKTCVPPDTCAPGNLCLPPSGPCCTAPSNPVNSVCTKSDRCFTYACDPKLNNSMGACTQQAVPVQPDSTCYKYKCNPTTGNSDPIPQDGLLCGTNNACVSTKCTRARPSDPLSLTCTRTENSTACTGTDKCFEYFCDPVTGCGKKSLVPTNTACETFTCDPKTGQISKFVKQTCCPPCDDSNNCTIDTAQDGDCKCIYTPKDCSGKNLCNTYGCDKIKGCTVTVNRIPNNDRCNQYSCDPLTGTVKRTDTCCVDIIKQCDAPDKCTTAKPKECECITSAITCEPSRDLCKETKCDPKVGCVTNQKAIPRDTTCDWYTCNSTTGAISSFKHQKCCPTCPPPDKCTRGSPRNATCQCDFTQIDDSECVKDDKCKSYFCDPKVGCTFTVNPVPPATCLNYSCIPQTGKLNATEIPNACVDSNNKCKIGKCELRDRNDILSARCVYTDVICNDNNSCTDDTCVPSTGCSFTPIDPLTCDDNNLCTTDHCNSSAPVGVSPCYHLNVTCNDTDVCHEVECRSNEGCVKIPISCPETDNCTISGCNATDNLGCYIESAGVCGVPVSAVGGLAGGVLGGIVAAALAGALITSSSAVASFSSGTGAGLGAQVKNNPLYDGDGGEGWSALHKVV